MVDGGGGQSLDESKAWIVSFLKQQFEELENENLQIYVIIMSTTEVVATFVEKNIGQDILKTIVSFKQKMANELGIILSFGMSNKSECWENLRDLYKQADTALNYTYGIAKGIVVRYEEVEGESQDDVNVTQISNDVRKILMEGDKESIEPFLLKYINDERRQKSYIERFAYAVVYSAEMVLLECGHSLKETLGVDIWEKMEFFERIINPKQWLGNILIFLVDSIHIKKDRFEDDKCDMVNKIKQIIEKKYGGKLTVGMIADELNYSSKHISEIFLELEKKSIFEYLTEYRINVAKEMLKEPDAKMYVVVESVGYKRKTHFNDVFKTYVGITPSQYKALYSSPERRE